MELTYPMKVVDKTGNYLLVSRANNGNLLIELKLMFEKRTRIIGTVDVDAKVLYVERKRSEHLHRKTQSYGFNDTVLQIGKKFNYVLLTDDRGRYKIPKQTIFDYGRYLQFKKQGFETQIFLRLAIIEKYRL
jgi:hypothetical protein